MNTTANEPFAPLAVGNYVVVGSDEEYAGLVGQVTEIIRFGSPEHDTGNPTDDIVVDLSNATYSDYMKDEIIALAKDLGYDDVESFEDVSLDCLILAPDDIIRITRQEYEQFQTELTASLQSASEVGERLSSEHYNKMYTALKDRVEKNYSDFEAHWLEYGNRELIDMVSKIHAVSDAHSHMTVYHNFSEEELRFYLQFQNPLDIVAEQWRERNIDLEDMSFTMDFLMEPERQLRMLDRYPLEKEMLTPRERLYDKLSAEYDTFIKDLKSKTPGKILEAAYEKVFKEDIIGCFEYSEDFSEKQIAVLLALENPLDELYRNWLHTDISHMDDLSDSITGYAIKEIERQGGIYEPEEAARIDNSEIPQAKPKPQAVMREPSLLDEVREAAREIDANKIVKSPQTTKNYDRGIE